MGAMSVIDAVGIIGVVVFTVSGALAAGRHRMDPVGFILLGTITAIGGGSLRDVLLDRPVFWTEAPEQLVISDRYSVQLNTRQKRQKNHIYQDVVIFLQW